MIISQGTGFLSSFSQIMVLLEGGGAGSFTQILMSCEAWQKGR